MTPSQPSGAVRVFLNRGVEAPPYAILKAARFNRLVAFYLRERPCDWAFPDIALQARFALSGSFASFGGFKYEQHS